MNQVKKTMTGFFIGLGIYTAIVELVGFFMAEDVLAFSLGLALGVAASVFLFCYMARTLDYALDLEEGDANKYVKRHSFLRLLVMFAILTVGMRVQRLSFIAVVLGLFGLKIGSLIAPFILKRLYPDDFITKPEDMVTIDDEEEELEY